VQFIGRNRVVLTALSVNPGKRMLRNAASEPVLLEKHRKNRKFIGD
jgi:hypothetical protein